MRRFLSDAERADMRRLREARKSISAIQAVHPDWSEATIRRAVAGVDVPRSSPWSRRCDPAVALRLRTMGLTFSAIGERFGVTKVAAFLACQNAVRSSGRTGRSA